MEASLSQELKGEQWLTLKPNEFEKKKGKKRKVIKVNPKNG